MRHKPEGKTIPNRFPTSLIWKLILIYHKRKWWNKLLETNSQNKKGESVISDLFIWLYKRCQATFRAQQMSQAQSVAQVTLVPVGRAPWAGLRQKEPAENQSSAELTTPTTSWELCLRAAHSTSVWTAVCYRGKITPFVNSLRLQNWTSSCKEPPQSLQGNQNTSLFPGCHLRAQISPCTAILILISACWQGKNTSSRQEVIKWHTTEFTDQLFLTFWITRLLTGHKDFKHFIMAFKVFIYCCLSDFPKICQIWRSVT